MQTLLYVIEQPRQLAIVAAIRRQLVRNNQLEITIHRQLAVVTLLKTLGGLHNGALRIGKVALRFILRHAIVPLVRRTASARRPPIILLVATPRRIRLPLRLFQAFFGLANHLQTPLAMLYLLGQLIAPRIRTVQPVLLSVGASRYIAQPGNLPFQPLLFCPQTLIAHRLMPARVRPYFGAINGHRAQTHQPPPAALSGSPARTPL